MCSTFRIKMRTIYNQNGTVDLCATRELRMGNPTEDELEEDGELEDFLPAKEEEDSETDMGTNPEEFWSDPCWMELPGIMG